MVVVFIDHATRHCIPRCRFIKPETAEHKLLAPKKNSSKNSLSTISKSTKREKGKSFKSKCVLQVPDVLENSRKTKEKSLKNKGINPLMDLPRVGLSLNFSSIFLPITLTLILN